MLVCNRCGSQIEKKLDKCPECGMKLNIISFQEKMVEKKEGNTKKNKGENSLLYGKHDKKISGGLLISAKKATPYKRLIGSIIYFLFINIPLCLIVLYVLPVNGAASLIMGSTLVTAMYNIWFHSKTGQTLGKKLVGIRVVSRDGNPMNLEKSFTREVGYVLARLIFGLGLLMIIFDRNNQGFHDKFAETYVVEIGDRISYEGCSIDKRG